MRPSERASVAAQTNLRRISGVSPSSSIRMHIVTWCEQHCNGLTRVGPAVGRTPRSPLPLLQADLHADKTNQVEGRFGHASDACVTRIGPGPFPTWLRCGLAQSGCGRGRPAGHAGTRRATPPGPQPAACDRHGWPTAEAPRPRPLQRPRRRVTAKAWAFGRFPVTVPA